MKKFSMLIGNDSFEIINASLLATNPGSKIQKFFEILSMVEGVNVYIEGYQDVFSDKEIQGGYDEFDRLHDEQEKLLESIEDDPFVPAEQCADSGFVPKSLIKD